MHVELDFEDDEEVTQHDIPDGLLAEHMMCPVAPRPMLEVIPDDDEPLFGLDDDVVRILPPIEEEIGELPKLKPKIAIAQLALASALLILLGWIISGLA